MKPAPFPLLAFVLIASTFGKEPAPIVTFVSPCECIAFHGVNRWVTKTDLTPVPSDKSAIQAITPSQIYAWEGLPPDVDMTDYTEARLPSEQKWYALTGRIVDAKVEADGDIHLALQDAEGNNVGTVSAEFPLAQNGVRFGKLCSGGRSKSFHSRSRPCTTLQLPNTSSQLRAKHSTTSHMRQQIIQTDDIRRKITLFGKFIP